jgi:tRNA (guanine-N(7)-)-methyltransferase subunit TRM82
MPKRPSALALTPDGQTLLCGDKFGDAYSLPLIPGEYVKRSELRPQNLGKPAATSLTVHTKRNLESLEQQRRTAEKKDAAEKAAKEKEALNFEHQVILGHVSVLLDLISASVPGDSPDSRARSYVLTADRDEHIRVSRGVPQVHVIEQYCLGHTSFVSKLCIPSWAPKVLVSGGGDGYLLVWNWTEGQIIQKISLDEAVQAQDVIVRGIWEVSLQQPAGPVKAIMVGLEGYVSLKSVKGPG